MSLIIFGIGSNLGNKKSNIIKANHLLKKAFGFENFLKASSLLQSTPLVKKDSPAVFSRLNYINSAIAFNLSSNPLLIFKKIKKIEKKMGRKNRLKWSPRKIDIDILIYEQNTMQSLKLTIPHVELLNRSFTLIPLIEILEKLKIDSSCYKNALKEIS